MAVFLKAVDLVLDDTTSPAPARARRPAVAARLQTLIQRESENRSFFPAYAGTEIGV